MKIDNNKELQDQLFDKTFEDITGKADLAIIEMFSGHELTKYSGEVNRKLLLKSKKIEQIFLDGKQIYPTVPEEGNISFNKKGVIFNIPIFDKSQIIINYITTK